MALLQQVIALGPAQALLVQRLDELTSHWSIFGSPQLSAKFERRDLTGGEANFICAKSQCATKDR